MKQEKTKEINSLKTLDEIKEDLLEKYQKDHVLYQKDIASATEHLDLSDDDTDELFDWLTKNDIEVSDDEDLNLNDPSIVLDEPDDIGDFDDLDLDDEFDEDDALASDIESLEQSFANSSQAKINDPVKMYLKEIAS